MEEIIIMEKEIYDLICFFGAVTIFALAAYIIYIHVRKNKENVKVAVIVNEPVCEIVNEFEEVLPVAKEVDEYLNVNNI